MSHLDPIFWLHHCNVDRLWSHWQATGNTTPGYAENYKNNFYDAAGKAVTQDLLSKDAAGFPKGRYFYDEPTHPALLAMNEAAFAGGRLLLAAPVAVTPSVLGKATVNKTIEIGQVTGLLVNAHALVPTMSASRTFCAAAPGPQRIMAVLNNITTPDPVAPTGVEDVFVNASHVTATSPASEAQPAATFSVFGGSHAGHEPASLAIDITRSLGDLTANGLIASETIQIRLIARKIADDGTAPFRFSVGSISIEAL